RVTFRNCTFYTCTFTEDDRKARYVNCRFISCTDAPDAFGLNFAADSLDRPSSLRVNVTLTAGGSYTFPSWVLQGRGAYFINVGGNGANLPACAGIIGKGSAT
ncbi:hypothetical protein, partial [Escherichia coli]|uniref:hypothetical protein n=1 Tax=Escherichia coli TaxID=562 RepID=UPI001F2A13B3